MNDSEEVSPQQLEELTAQARQLYAQTRSIDAVAIELQLSLTDTTALLGEVRAPANGWRIDFPEIGPAWCRRT